MSNKNTAKEWQKGWYQIHVGDTEIAVRTKRNGKVYETLTLCHPDDEFSLSEGVKIAMKRLEEAINPDVIMVGDKVKIKDVSEHYSLDAEWVKNNVTNLNDIAKWRYGVETDDNGDVYRHVFTVKYIGDSVCGKLAFVCDDKFEMYGNYLMPISALEKINE